MVCIMWSQLGSQQHNKLDISAEYDKCEIQSESHILQTWNVRKQLSSRKGREITWNKHMNTSKTSNHRASNNYP